MRILMITENFRLGGKERRIIELLKKIEHLPSMQCEVVILSDQIEYSEVYSFTKIKIRIIKRRIRKDPSVFYKFYRIIRTFKPDIVHSWGPMPSIYAFPITWLMGIKLINNMVSNAVMKTFSSNWFRAMLSFPFSDLILSNSWAGLAAYKVTPSKGRVIYNGFDFLRLKIQADPVTVKEKYGIRSSFVVGMVGVFHPRKDFSTFLAAANHIIEENNDICFVAAGNGPDLEYFRSLYAGSHGGRIVLPGLVENVEELVSVFDIGVLITNTQIHQEGISNSIMEYMACGKPVIATRGGGTTEIVEDNKNGFLIDPFSEVSLTRTIYRLYNSPAKRLELGKQGKATIMNSFSIDKMISEYLEVYQELMPDLYVHS